jgi:hypothetical protein
MTRRDWLALVPVAASAAPVWPASLKASIAGWLESHRRAPGAYGWASDSTPQLTPTFAVAACYRLLSLPLPDPAATATFVRANYPVPERRRIERPLWRFDYEQVQTLLWLGRPVDEFRALASTWTQPAGFTRAYELAGNPVFQQQAMAVVTRGLLGLPATDEWRAYFLARRRPGGAFNTTPAADASPGHLMNTLWGLLACDALGLPGGETVAAWVLACRLSNGAFTYAPGATLGAVDDVAYAWAALRLLERERRTLPQPDRTAAWLSSLLTPVAGFQDRPGGEPNPLAAYYALDCFRLLGRVPRRSAAPAPRAPRHAIPPGARVWSIQIEAPGNGSPQEAVSLARDLRIHLWTAKNSPPGWIDECRRIARAENVPVGFHHGDEEYGTFTAVPGLGCYSHLVDLVAPYGRDSGRPLPRKNHPYPWAELRDTRIAALRAGAGRLIWQFLESEELTRVLLDEACARPTYAAIASFHFGNENFLHSQPFLQRWYERLPFVALQDAHGRESWWWATMLAGFTTLFVARDPSWESWLAALDRRHVLAVRHDAVTAWRTQLAGGSPALRDYVLRRAREWRWWDDTGRLVRRPPAVLSLLRPGDRFEAAAPLRGLALRVRLWAENNGQGLPQQDQAELLALRLDGRAVALPAPVRSREDRYYLLPLPDDSAPHWAEADVRLLAGGAITTLSRRWNTA